MFLYFWYPFFSIVVGGGKKGGKEVRKGWGRKRGEGGEVMERGGNLIDSRWSEGLAIEKHLKKQEVCT